MAIPADVRKEVLSRDKGCRYCGRAVVQVVGDDAPYSQRWRALDSRGITFQFDHVVPLSAGGLSTADNLVLACPECNLAKSRSYDKKMAGPGRGAMTRIVKLSESVYLELEELKGKGDTFCDVVESLLQARRDLGNLVGRYSRPE